MPACMNDCGLSCSGIFGVIALIFIGLISKKRKK